MKRNILNLTAAVVLGLSMAACSSSTEETTETAEATLADGTLTVDNAASTVTWKGEMLGLYSHEGTVPLTAGTIEVSNGVVSGGSFTIDLTSINPTDDAYDEENTKEKLVGHLSSADFFSVEEFPTASFEITGSEGSKVMGNLTVRGITNAETVENVVIVPGADGTTMSGTLTFDRTKYDVNFSMPVQDKVLSNDIAINVMLSAK